MSATAANQARAAALKAARAKDSQHKRQRTLAALQTLEATGAAITFTAVAKAAGVSTWLVYSDGIREHIDAARHHQNNYTTGTPSAPSAQPATPDSLRTDLAIAREQIKTLRTERDKLQQRLRLQLGAELEAPDRAHLTTRVADLETINRQLVDRDARTIEVDAATHRVAELEDELSAARESLRRVIKAQNRAP